MNTKRAEEEIKNMIEAYLTGDEHGAYAVPVIRQRPVLPIEPSGVGKAQIMEQISQEYQTGLVSYIITHHTRRSTIGLPYIEEKIYDSKWYSVTEYTMNKIVGAIYEKMEQTGLHEGILFIGEINCVSGTLASTMFQFLQCKVFGNHNIPEGWMIMAAGNPPEHNKSVREFDIVTLDRIKLIYVEPDFAVWREYTSQVNIHPAILSYLEVKKQYFCQTKTMVDGKLFVTSRGWEDLPRLMEIYEKLERTVDRGVISQYIQHAKIAKDFFSYPELYYKYEGDHRPEEILSSVIREFTCDKFPSASFDEKVSVISFLQAKLDSVFKALVEKEAPLEILKGVLQQMDPGKNRTEHGPEELRVRTMKDTTSPDVKQGIVPLTDAQEKLESLLSGVVVGRDYKEELKPLNRAEGRRYQESIRILEEYLQTLKTEHLVREGEVRQRLKVLLGEESDHYKIAFNLAGKMLEHGFDFMETAFGDSREVVVFITGLNASYASIHYPQNYSCEWYFQYNKKLLFDGHEQEVLSKIRERKNIVYFPGSMSILWLEKEIEPWEIKH